MSYPSATRFRAALRKRGINVSTEYVQEIVKDQSVRQLSAPRPNFTGRVTARFVDERWACDLMDFSAKSTKGSPVHVLIVQDIFSRFLFAKAIRSKTQVRAAFERLLQETDRRCQELNSD